MDSKTLTVADLIEALKKYPQHLPVRLEGTEWDCDLKDVERVDKNVFFPDGYVFLKFENYQ